jgi:hypothetical protein
MSVEAGLMAEDEHEREQKMVARLAAADASTKFAVTLEFPGTGCLYKYQIDGSFITTLLQVSQP